MSFTQHQETVFTQQRQTFRQFNYLTHAFCSNCYELKRPIFWYEKPLARCPYCKRSLKQKPNDKKSKERLRALEESKTEELENYQADYNKAYYEKNKEKILARIRQKRQTQDQKEKEKATAKIWKENNAEKLREYHHNYYQLHKEDIEKERHERIKRTSNLPVL